MNDLYELLYGGKKKVFGAHWSFGCSEWPDHREDRNLAVAITALRLPFAERSACCANRIGQARGAVMLLYR